MDAVNCCVDLKSLSNYLGFAPQHLFYLVEAPDRFYSSFQIPKKSNPLQYRQIDIPYSELKGVQRSINQKILNGVELDPSVYSYRVGKSILSAAGQFCPGRAVLKLDIADFFPTISFRRVFGLFRSYGFNDNVCYILSRLCTFNNRIAQGAPTSPMISNLILKSFDKNMRSLSLSWEMKYLRYSDDLFFHHEKNFNHRRLAELVEKTVNASGFMLNSEKTRYYAKGKPRITLGLLTNSLTPRIPGPQRRKYRSLFFKASRNFTWAYQNEAQLRGILEWYKSVYGRNDTYSNYKVIYDNINRLQFHDSYRSQ